MWVFTTSDFVSAIFRDGAIQVRASDRKSLERLVKQTGAAITATQLTDYPYQIAITNQQFAPWVSQVALSINYQNFKSEFADVRGYGFAKPLNQAWTMLHEAEDEKAWVL